MRGVDVDISFPRRKQVTVVFVLDLFSRDVVRSDVLLFWAGRAWLVACAKSGRYSLLNDASSHKVVQYLKSVTWKRFGMRGVDVDISFFPTSGLTRLVHGPISWLQLLQSGNPQS